jgi:predicted nuclease of predicted toxin-antitoxin system
MGVKFLLDENLEHEVLHRLETLGYEAAHVERHRELGKGSEDASIAEFSLQREWVVVTYDPDFVTAYSEAEYYGIVYFDDDDLSASEVVTILHSMATHYPASEFGQLQYGSREWL